MLTINIKGVVVETSIKRPNRHTWNPSYNSSFIVITYLKNEFFETFVNLCLNMQAAKG